MTNRMLLTKLYVPRIILPLGQMTAGIVEPAIILLVFVGTLVYYRSTDGIWYVHASPRLLASAASVALILAFARMTAPVSLNALHLALFAPALYILVLARLQNARTRRSA